MCSDITTEATTEQALMGITGIVSRTVNVRFHETFEPHSHDRRPIMNFWKKLFGASVSDTDSLPPSNATHSAANRSSPPPPPLAKSAPAKKKTYKSQQWDFNLAYPADWQVVHENVQAGDWQVAVGIAGPPTNSGRAGIMVNAKRGPVTADGGGGWMKVTVVGSAGQSSSLPTPQEFIERAKREAARSFNGFQFESSGELQVAGGSGVRIRYSYDGDEGRVEEMNITRFATFSTFQFTCEAPAKDWASAEALFNQIIESFTLA